MKGTVFSVLCALGALAVAGTGERQFGLHFDFHAKPEADGSSALIGGTLKESDIAEICDLYRPDFIQVDSKRRSSVRRVLFVPGPSSAEYGKRGASDLRISILIQKVVHILAKYIY